MSTLNVKNKHSPLSSHLDHDEFQSCLENTELTKKVVSQDVASSEDIAHLIHELQEYQVELEKQNQQLQKSQVELKHTEYKYIEFNELAPVGYITVNHKGLILNSNLYAAMLLELNKDEMVNRKISDFINPLDQDIFYSYKRKILSHKKASACELRLLKSNQEKIWVKIETAIIKDEENDEDKFLTIITDISLLKKVEKDLRENEARLALILEANGEGIWDWDITNDRVRHNEKWYKLLELEKNPENETVTFFASLLHDDDRGKVFANIQKAIEETGQYRSEHRMRQADGRYIWVLDKGVVVKRDKTGKALRMVGSFVDISERKFAEQKERQHQQNYERLLKLETVNQTVAAIAHELNQPLNAAASYSDAALHLLKEENPEIERVIYALKNNSQQIQRAGQVMKELCKFLQSGSVKTAPLVLNDIIHKVISILKEDGHLGKFKTVYKLADVIPKVNANALQLEKVLINIIRNGIEAMHNSGLVEGLIEVTVSSADNSSCAQVTISDNGPGVDAKMIQHIFEPFYSSKAGGLGMGLAISRAIIEAQGGQLWCQPEDSEGASFHLTIPYIVDDGI